MRAMWVTLAIGGIAACHTGSRPDDFVPFVDASTVDAAPDAPCGYGYPRYPITATGSTPAGSLDDYHDASAGYICHWYSIVLSHTVAGEGCTSDRWMLIDFNFPENATQPGSGSFPADASEFEWTISPDALDSTTQISFEATVVDPPSRTDEMHLVGHLVANASGWSFDLPVDLYAPPGIGSCTLIAGKQHG